MRKLNFDVFMCDKCGEIVLIIDVVSLNKVTSHSMNCVCNAKIKSDYKKELLNCKTSIEREMVHTKYLKIL